MFNSLTGTVTGKMPKQLFLQTGGIEWDISVPDSSLEKLPSVGKEARVFTWMQHTDTLMVLFGFASSEERTLFLDLLKVDGVGPKGALKIMSSIDSSELCSVLENGDVASLEKIPGIGKKTAGKMMLTLKGKLTIPENEKVVRISQRNPFSDVVDSLCAMGYDKNLVTEKIASLSESLSSDSAFSSKSQKDKEDFLFRRALMELS